MNQIIVHVLLIVPRCSSVLVGSRIHKFEGHVFEVRVGCFCLPIPFRTTYARPSGMLLSRARNNEDAQDEKHFVVLVGYWKLRVCHPNRERREEEKVRGTL